MTKIETGLGAGLDKSLSRLDGFYRKKTLAWLVSLYDSERGGFYYSDSAKRYEGFLPDAESTYQILSLLYGGAVKGVKDKLREYMPTDMQAALADFVASMSDGDGYYYHPQWGREVSDARRKSDRACCKGIIERLGVSGEDKESGSKDNDSKKAAEKPAREQLSSREAFIEYLDGLIKDGGLLSAAVKLRGEYKDIKDASLASVLFDYLDALQSKFGTGYWHDGIEELAPELYRIGALYNEGERKIPRAEQLVHNSVALILSDEVPESVVEIHIAWAALATILKNVQMSAASESDERGVASIFSFVRGVAPDMIDKTLGKLRAFKKSSGGYSYYLGYSPAYAHSAHVALGIDEADVNATLIAVHGVRSNIFYSLGLTVPPIWQAEELKKLIDKPKRAMKKRPVPKRFAEEMSVKTK